MSNKIKSIRTKYKALAVQRKSVGQACKHGETAAKTDCIPASGESSKNAQRFCDAGESPSAGCNPLPNIPIMKSQKEYDIAGKLRATAAAGNLKALKDWKTTNPRIGKYRDSLVAAMEQVLGLSKKKESGREKVETEAADWLMRWSLTPGHPNLPKELPSEDVLKIFAESKPTEPVELCRHEREDHDPQKTDMSTKIPLQAWSDQCDVWEQSINEVNTDPKYKGPKFRLLKKTFRPEDIAVDFGNLPDGINNKLKEMGMGGDMKHNSEVLVWYHRPKK